MKKPTIFFVFLALLAAGHVSAQFSANATVPSVIRNDFAAAHPDVADFEWERDGDLYQVEFETADEVDYEIWYDASGAIVRQEVEIATEDLPAAVHRTLAADFEGYTVDDPERVTTSDGDTYQMELEALLKEDWEVTFTADGRLLSRTED